MTSGPSLRELPPPPAGREGWPWTVAAPVDGSASGGRWPTISVITPSLNQGDYVEEAIRSVLLQGYPAVEFIIMDGGSTDGTVDVLKRYDPWIATWRSERDRGPVQALNKALALATGDLLTWVSCDDFFLPGALHALARAHREAPGTVILGNLRFFDADGAKVWVGRQLNVSLRTLVDPLNSQASWYGAGMCVPRALYEGNGPFDESVPYVTDYDWMCRLMLRGSVHYLPMEVTGFRVHAGSTSVAHDLAQATQLLQVVQRYWPHVTGLDARARAQYPLRQASMFLGHNTHWAPLWNRAAGARALLECVRRYPPIVANRRFLKLCARLVLPLALLRSSPWRTPA